MMLLSVASGLFLVAGVLVIVLAIIATLTGAAMHNIASMMFLAATSLIGSACLQYALSLISSNDSNKKHNTSTEKNDCQTTNVQHMNFDPWTDEWYGKGPWWKKW